MTFFKTLLHNFRQLLIAFDQFCNVLICMIMCPKEEAWADETFSSHCYRWDIRGLRGWPRKAVDAIALLFMDRDHCKESYESERLRRQMPPELR